MTTIKNLTKIYVENKVSRVNYLGNIPEAAKQCNDITSNYYLMFITCDYRFKSFFINYNTLTNIVLFYFFS